MHLKYVKTGVDKKQVSKN